MGFARAGDDITAGAVMVAAKGLIRIGRNWLTEGDIGRFHDFLPLYWGNWDVLI